MYPQKYCRGNYTPKSFKPDFLKEQENRCAICHCLPKHNGKQLIFILDHIDGNAANNKRDNLRLICPNCDSQLDTYKSKNKHSTRRNYWKEHIIKTYKKNTMTNKEFQDILNQFDGDYIICMDKAFGYDTEPNLVDPHLYINTDIGQIEIEPDEYKMLQSATILKAMELYDKLKPKLSFIGHNEVSANLITNMINYGIEDIDNKNAEVLI